MAFAYRVAKLKLFASISATDAKPRNVSCKFPKKDVKMKKIITFIILITSIVSCSINEKSLESLILNELENSKELNLSNYNEFDWDSLIILGPYSNIEKIEMEKNIDLSNVSNSIEMLDNINLIVFLKQGKVVRYSEINRNIADFNDYQEIIKKENSNFTLDVNQNNTKILKVK